MLEDLITNYGYIAIFGMLMFGIAGLPVPEELLLLYAGYNVSMHRLSLFPTITSGVAGAMCGITVSFLIGRFIGLPVVHRFGRFLHVTDENLQRVHNWYERWGKWTLTFGYYVPGVRHLTALVAGTTKMEWHEFAAFAYGGAVMWANTFVLTGYFLGPQTLELAGIISRDLTLFSVAIILSVTVILLVRYYIVRTSKSKNNL